MKKQVKEKAPDVAWIENSVTVLKEAGYSLDEIRNFTLNQFLILLQAAERRDALRRTRFVTDVAVVLGGLLGGGTKVSEHIASLQKVIDEERDDGS